MNDGGIRPFILISAATALVSLSTFAHGLLLPLYMKEAGLSEAYIGLVVGTLALSLVLGRFASGWAIDHFGARTFLWVGAVVWGLTSPLVVTTTQPALLMVIRVAQGIALAFFTNAAIGYVSHAAAEHVRGRALSLWWMVWSSAVAIGPVLAGAAMNAWGYAVAFALTGALSVLAVAPSLLIPALRPDRDRAARLTLLPGRALAPGLVGAAIGFAAGGFGTFLPLHGHALKMENPGLLLAALGIGIVPGQFIFGKLSDTRGRPAAVVPAFIVALVAALAISQFAALGPALALAFLAGFGTSGISPVLTAWAVDRGAAWERASAASSSVAFRELGSFLGASAMGALLGAAGHASAFAVMSVVLAAGLAGVMFAARAERPDVKER